MTAAQNQNTPVITSKSDNSKFTKIALIVLAVTFLIIISEVAYLVFAKPGNSIFKMGKATEQEESERSALNPPLQPTPTSVQNNQEQNLNVNSAEGLIFIDSLKRLADNGKLEPSDVATMYFEISGQVISASFTDEVIDGTKYVYLLIIEREAGSQIGYRLNEEEVLIAQVKLSNNGEEEEGSLTDIQEGDTIVAKSTINLLDKNPHSSVSLEIIR